MLQTCTSYFEKRNTNASAERRSPHRNLLALENIDIFYFHQKIYMIEYKD